MRDSGKLSRTIKVVASRAKVAVAAMIVVGVTGGGLALATPSPTGLVAHWSLDQSSGTTVTDNSGNGHTAAFAGTGTPAWAAGKINNGLSFTTNSYANAGNLTQIDGVSQVTLAAWVKRSANGQSVEIGKQATNNDLAIEDYNDGQLYFDLSNGSEAYGSVALSDTNWHHVVLVFDGTQTGNANRLKGYVDGVQKTLTFSGTVGTKTTTNTAAFGIGKVNNDYSRGTVDDVWLYARALSTAEVQDLYNMAGAPADTTAPSVPTNVVATASSVSQVGLSWTASTDNVGVAGYKIFRGGVQVGTATGTSYTDTGLTASTSYNYTVRAYDAAGNTSADSTPPATATTLAAPTVSLTASPSAIAIAGSSTLTWTSTSATSCTASGGWSGAQAVNGSQMVSGITAQTTYTLTCTGNGAQAVSSATVTILPECSDGIDNDGDGLIDMADPGCSSPTDNDETNPDTTAPTVSLTAPTDGSTVSGTINMTATATDNVAVASVAFSVDGTQQGSPDTTAPYGMPLNTANLSNGTHTIRATATDTSGNTAISEVNVTVNNFVDVMPPTVSFTAPASGASVSGTVAVSANASDDTGVAGVKFYANGTLIGSEVTMSPYSLNWDTTGVANGSVQLTAVARDAAGNTATAAETVAVNNPVATTPFVTRVSANGRYFLDQNGQPILIKGVSPWALPMDVSPAEGEMWAADRQSHGFNAAITALIGSVGMGGSSDSGATYDGILPFNNGDVTSWNEAYWSRMDAFMTSFENHGLTVFLYPMDTWSATSGVFSNVSNADAYTYGQMVAKRFAKFPNIVWMVGGDYNGYNDALNAKFTNMLAGIRSTGDNRLFSIHLNTESVSTNVATYEPLAGWNFAYSYSDIYDLVLGAYNRTPSVRDPRPVVLGESNYEGENDTGGPATTNETLRRQQLWALTSGAAGDFTGSADWMYPTGWESRLDTTWITQDQKLHDFWSGLNWEQLVPDTASPLVTAGRGTHTTGYSTLDVLQIDWVTAAQTPDKSLSVVYVPTDTSDTNARTITLDLTKLPTSYTASWVDPTDATQSQPATINASGQVTTPGLHSDSTRDWLLVVRGN